MDIVAFAIWKFRNVEGFLQGMSSFDVNTTKYVDPVDKSVSWIKYDYGTEKATIERTKHKDSFWAFSDSGITETVKVECKFSELVSKLKELGMYTERPSCDRHALTGPQKEE